MVEEIDITEKKGEGELIWEKEDLKKNIRALENQIFIAEKHQGDVDNLVNILKSTIHNFVNNNFIDAEKDLIDIKKELIAKTRNLSTSNRIQYIISSWGLLPIITAISAIICSFAIIIMSDVLILGVPLWAPLIGLIGASVQILVGVVNDYKENSMISKYKRLWYFTLPTVGFVFGFIAFLVIQAGLIDMTQGRFDISQPNQTFAFTMPINQTNQTISVSSTTTTSTRLELPIIICFLAGYATEWFMGLLAKFTGPKS